MTPWSAWCAPTAATSRSTSSAGADRAIVVVVDADGRPAPNCLEVCAAGHLFDGAAMGAVQVDVRMVNAGVRKGCTACGGSSRNAPGGARGPCVRHVRRIWDSAHLSTLGAAEMPYYLDQPWMQLLGTLT